MRIAVVKYLNRFGTVALRPPFYTLRRTNATEPCPPKAPEPCTPPAGPKCPEPPPCTPMPQCPSTICPPVVDPNNPCNYCPPPCIDPTYPDITKLKKLQCFFQQEDGLPMYLKKGNADAFLFQLTLVLVIISFIFSILPTIKVFVK